MNAPRQHNRPLRSIVIAMLTGLLAVMVPSTVQALTRHHRPTWYPEDMDLQKPGEVELNLRSAWLATRTGQSVVLPDVELDVGVDRQLELGIDAQAGWATGSDGWAPLDQIWLSVKHLLVDHHGKGRSWALGLQHGPRVGVLGGSRLLGYQALAMGAIDTRTTHWVVSVGGFVDPQDSTLRRPVGAVVGLDGAWQFSDDWTLEPSAAATEIWGHGVDLLAACDVAWAVRDWMTLRGGVLVGRLDGAGTVGVQVGVSPIWARR